MKAVLQPALHTRYQLLQPIPTLWHTLKMKDKEECRLIKCFHLRGIINNITAGPEWLLKK